MSQSQPRFEFVSETGVEVPAVTAAQMREVDRIAVEETGPNLFQMMENAGRNLASLAIERLGARWKDAQVVVIAGPGGNGGGGICAARHLANRGVEVRLCLATESLSPVPAFQRKVFQATAGHEVRLDQLASQSPDLILDGVLGYSLDGPPRGAAAELIRWANGSGAPILALDVPSGLDSTTGGAPGDVVSPRWTMTLALPKTGLIHARVGELFLADIGIPEGAYRRLGLPYRTPFDHRYRIRLARGQAAGQ
jgi:NAD(P)H-hydrate epimerase